MSVRYLSVSQTVEMTSREPVVVRKIRNTMPGRLFMTTVFRNAVGSEPTGARSFVLMSDGLWLQTMVRTAINA